ncbi:hypothetical protein MMC11_007403 [Xylographa trunciseda]|nr:hypothetical protein [Xylographa trunciseda]
MPGTSSWIFEHPSYQAWLNPRGASCLWISGDAGSGKSTLSAAILDNLKRQQSNSSTYISCFSDTYIGYTDSARAVLRILICQLIRYEKPSAYVSILSSLLDDLEQYLHTIPQASFRRHLKTIFNALNAKQSIALVFDDFDCNEWIKPTVIDEIIKANLHRSKLGKIKCLFTSRSSYVIVTESSSQFASIDMSKEPGVYSDMFHYAMKNVAVLPSISFEQSQVFEVSRRLCYRAEGIFLWVRLALEDLQDSCEPLETVENIPLGIEGIYEKRLRLILPRDRLIAHKIFSWLAVAYRTLSALELCEALTIDDRRLPCLTPVEQGDTKDESQFSETEINRICGSLARVTEEGTVMFRHSSVKRYLLSKNGSVISGHGVHDSYELVAKTCLLILASDDESPNILIHNLSQTEPEIRRPVSSLFRYVATYWTSHVRLVERRSRSVNTILQYLFERALKKLCQWHSIPDYMQSTRAMRTCLLQLYAYHGFSSLAQMYLETGVDPNDRPCTSCDMPLNIAASRGHPSFVGVLLKKGAWIDVRTNDTRETPLHGACSIGSLGIAKILIRSNSDTCNTSDLFGNTPLHIAAAHGHVDILKLLIDSGADINAVTKASHETPLFLAAYHGHQQAVMALLDGRNVFPAEADVYGSITQQPYFQTWSEDLVQDQEKNGAFVWEADARDLAEKDMQNLLLSTKQYADPSIRNYSGRTALQEAALYGHEGVVQVLLDGDDEFTGSTKDQFCALQLAAEHGHLSVVKLLLKRGVYQSSGSKDWGSLIERVSNNGYQAVANLLMWQAFGTEIAGAAFKWPMLSLVAAGSKHNTVQEILHRKRTQRERMGSPMKRSGSGAGEKRTSYRLPFRCRNS